ncbi:pyridoxamine 5'-phosphate oxidase family protein [Natronospirillum operosum]|uniref:Pyridoxamine 5'-phosphate oxidase family protein n=1 Tax=Natronospirillum operosum TaxID=2759953 RepID=A0A4Z0W3L5_9GAMM|nr:pyridoxamine 5'-phosphate oxidase family protein [Natronospirillum operosum]TGG91718.1 pyridoxamine 5'-phosphate oxidase family protein [Natronospirillum operosum]
MNEDPFQITDSAALEALYGTPAVASLRKEVDYIHPHYQAFIAASPFMVLASSGPGGLDVSPRGDQPGFVEVKDDKTLLLPDRRGNNRIDTLRNIVTDPRVALIFLVPGVGEALRVMGHARITTDPELLGRFAVAEKLPKTVLVVHVESVYFQCARAVLRAGLWDPARQVDRKSLPSTGAILEALSQSEIDGEQYDQELPQRLKNSLY